jgi:hypothetical protein
VKSANLSCNIEYLSVFQSFHKTYSLPLPPLGKYQSAATSFCIGLVARVVYKGPEFSTGPYFALVLRTLPNIS